MHIYIFYVSIYIFYSHDKNEMKSEFVVDIPIPRRFSRKSAKIEDIDQDTLTLPSFVYTFFILVNSIFKCSVQ